MTETRDFNRKEREEKVEISLDQKATEEWRFQQESDQTVTEISIERCRESRDLNRKVTRKRFHYKSEGKVQLPIEKRSESP